MREALGNTLEVYVGPLANGRPGDGTLASPCADVAAAIDLIARRHDQGDIDPPPAATHDQIQIVSIPHAGTIPRKTRARYRYFVDPTGTGRSEGDGSMAAPWPNFDAAFSGIKDLYGRGTLPLAAGQSLRLSVRGVFAATPVERRKKRSERIAGTVFLLMTLTLVLPVLLILTYLVVKAWPVLTLSFIFENPRNNMTAGGIWAPLIGTFYLVFVSLLAAAPIGILAGIYLNEYARDNWFTRIVNLAVVNLAGVPSIVHALFGVGAFVVFAGLGESVLAASLTVAIMSLPVIITSTREALASVPRPFREACWNLGASRWQTIRTIVLPNSISGILTGVIFEVSRAAGETAPILFTGAAFFVNVPDEGLGLFFPYSLNDSFMALSYHLHTVLTQVRGASPEEIATGEAMSLEHLQYGTAVVLIGLVLLFNSVSIGLRTYLRSRKKW